MSLLTGPGCRRMAGNSADPVSIVCINRLDLFGAKPTTFGSIAQVKVVYTNEPIIERRYLSNYRNQWTYGINMEIDEVE